LNRGSKYDYIFGLKDILTAAKLSSRFSILF
jgi:hypothetical protein